MAARKNRKGDTVYTVSATLSQRAYDAIEEARWSERKNLSQMIESLIAERYGLATQPLPETGGAIAPKPEPEFVSARKASPKG